MAKYAAVAVDAKVDHSRTFTYSVPESLDVRQGHLVKVPLGSREVSGVVFSVIENAGLSDTREIIGIVYPEVVLTQTQLALAEWISGYYMAPLFQSSLIMMPPGLALTPRVFVNLTSLSPSVNLTDVQGKIIDYLASNGRVERSVLERSLGIHKSSVDTLRDIGVIETEWVWSKPKTSPRYDWYLECSLPRHELEIMLPSISTKTPRQAKLLQKLLHSDLPTSYSSIVKEFDRAIVKKLEAKRLVNLIKYRVDRDPLAGREFLQDEPHALTSDQRKAIVEIQRSLDSGSSRVFLLNGVSGSGKTEVYMHSIAHAIANGKQAIMMVPELSLAPQTVDRFGSRFPGQIAILHSGLTNGERLDQWERTDKGESNIVIGSRGAIFAPQKNLGIIVLDEEHEWTYKQQDALPLYHAREVAIKLAALTRAVVILGSATPDVVSTSRAERGLYHKLSLPSRIERPASLGGQAHHQNQQSQIVDLRDELGSGNRGLFSRLLVRSIKGALDAGNQIMLYLNRRGSGSLVQCRGCGHTLLCRRCDLPLTYHSETERLLCHQCNYRLLNPRQCPECFGPNIRYMGLGTQRVVDEVFGMFPGVRILRWDRDSSTTQRSHQDTMDSFQNGEADILVGTQMIAKGLHFPNVTLVGVLCADIGLFSPDYRAGERAFQLIYQMAGRSGRESNIGEAVIQTYSPSHYAIVSAAKGDYLEFYAREISYRREHRLPPFGKLIRLSYAHTNNDRCSNIAANLVSEMKKQRDIWGFNDVDILGAAPAYPPRLRGRYIWQVILRGQDPRSLLDKVNIPSGWVLDVDPISIT